MESCAMYYVSEDSLSKFNARMHSLVACGVFHASHHAVLCSTDQIDVPEPDFGMK